MRGNTGTAKRKYSRGFTQAGGLLQNRIQKTGSARGFAQMRLLTHWEEIVGADIARIARPAKVAYGRQGFGAKLTLIAKPAHAPELQMRLPEIKQRVNASYGYSAISDIRITQTGEALGFAEAPSGFAHDHPAPSLPPATAEALRSELADVKDETLRALLNSLGTNILLTSKGSTQ